MSEVDKMTRKSQEAMQSAAKFAEVRQASAVEPEHLLSELLIQTDGLVPRLIELSGGNLQKVKEQVATSIDRLPQVQDLNLGMSESKSDALPTWRYPNTRTCHR